MKKILVIGLSSVLGGVETYIYNLIRFSNLKKYDFDFLIIGEKKSVFEDEINEIFGDNKNHFYYCPNLKRSYKKGIKWLSKFYNQNSYDFIYLNTCTCAKIQYCLKGIKNGAKLISHSHNGNGNSKFNNAFFRPIVNKYSIERLSCSDVAGKWLFGNHKDFKIIPNGVDTERFKFNINNRKKYRNELHVNDDDIIIGHVGRFSIQKNHQFFLNIAGSLPQNYKFLFIGDGELKDDFVKKIKDMQMDKRFIILPSISDVEKYYSVMDIFMMPSLYEGLPIVSVEAQTNGLSCIFSDTVSVQSDLSEHCYFLSLSSINDWIKKITSINYERYDGVQSIIGNKFDVNSTVKLIENIIESKEGK